MSYSLVKKWSARFKCGAMSTEDDHHTGRPTDATSDEVEKKINKVVLADRRVIKDHVVSVGSVSNILHHRSNFRKVSAM